jgi:hypothetical protein
MRNMPRKPREFLAKTTTVKPRKWHFLLLKHVFLFQQVTISYIYMFESKKQIKNIKKSK